MWQKSLIKFLIVCGALALHEVVFKPVYIAYLEGQGLVYGVGEALFGYALILAPAWIVAWMLTRPMKRVKVSAS